MADEWGSRIAEGPGKISMDLTAQRNRTMYCVALFDDQKRVLENRFEVPWAEACDILGRSAERSEVDYAIVRRLSDELIVLRYSAKGDRR